MFRKVRTFHFKILIIASENKENKALQKQMEKLQKEMQKKDAIIQQNNIDLTRTAYNLEQSQS